MKRFLLFISLLAALALLMANVDALSYNFQIEWGDWHISLKPIILIIGLLVLVVVLDISWRLLALLYTSPRKFRALFSRRAQRKMGEVLHKSLLGMAVGDSKSVAKSLSTLEAKDNHTPVSQLVMYLAHQHLGTQDQATPELVNELATHENTEIVLLKAQVEQFMLAQDYVPAIPILNTIIERNPTLNWAHLALMKALIHRTLWDLALPALDAAQKSGVYTRAQAARWRAGIYTAQAHDETLEGVNATRTKLIRNALKADPNLLPAILLNVQDMIAKNEWRGAAKAIETQWVKTPHPHLGQIYITLRAGDSVSDKLARAHTLASRNPDHFESHILTAQAALLAGRADEFLAALAPYTKHASQRICLLLHSYEHTRSENSMAAREWLLKGMTAPPDAGWCYDDLLAPYWGLVHPHTHEICLPKWHSGIFEGSTLPSTARQWGALKAIILPSDAKHFLLTSQEL